MNRRSFFTRVAKAIIIASSAPVILREALCRELPKATIDPFWIQTWRHSSSFSEEYEAITAKIFEHFGKEMQHIGGFQDYFTGKEKQSISDTYRAISGDSEPREVAPPGLKIEGPSRL